MKRSRLVAVAVMALASMGLSAPVQKPIDLPGERLHPESISIAADGTAYVGSMSGGVLRVSLATGKSEQWIKPGDFGSSSTFGLLVDTVNGVLWVCNNDISANAGVTIPGGDKGAVLKAFDLKSGEGRLSYRLPGEKPLCNDMAVARDGTLYVSETSKSLLFRLKPGASALEKWGNDPAYGSPDGSGLDGIAIGGDGNLYVNNIRSNKLIRVAINPDGSAGKAAVLETSRELASPDGLRSLGGLRFVQVEGAGKVATITVTGDKAEIETLGEGYSSPAGVDAHDGTYWFVQGEFKYLFNPQFRGQMPPKFQLIPVSAQ